MSDEELLAAFKKWMARVGREKAGAELFLNKFSPRTVERLVSGEYHQSPRKRLREFLEAVAKKAS